MSSIETMDVEEFTELVQSALDLATRAITAESDAASLAIGRQCARRVAEVVDLYRRARERALSGVTCP